MEQMNRMNPLKVPEILENILECLILEDLKASRLVNKFWRDCGIRPMKKKEENQVRLGGGGFVEKTIEDLAKFVECLNSVAGGNTNFPCSQVLVDASLIRQDKKVRNQDDVLFANFLQNISPWVTELELITNLRERITANAFPLSLNFPKLKVLKLTHYSMNTNASKRSVGNLYRFITSILERAPSLSKVDFNIENDHSVDSILKAWKTSFTEMQIFGAISNNSLEKLSRWDGEMKLKSLQLSFVKPEVNNTSLFQVLRNQNDSLETLELYFDDISSPNMVSFPEMPKLKSLTVGISYDDDDESTHDLVTFPVISYQRQFPALKALHLNPVYFEATSLCKQFIKQEMSPVETIEELTLPESDHDDESLLIAQIVVRIFPYMKKLEVAADPVTLPTIFKHLTNLEQLTLISKSKGVRVSGCIDFVLMGYTCLGYKRLERRIKRAGENFDWKLLEPGNVEESIINLQKLRVLTFDNWKGSQELEVGRASLHLILSRIRTLRCVDFCGRRYPMETEMDKAWWAELNEDCVVLWYHVGRKNKQDFEK